MPFGGLGALEALFSQNAISIGPSPTKINKVEAGRVDWEVTIGFFRTNPAMLSPSPSILQTGRMQQQQPRHLASGSSRLLHFHALCMCISCTCTWSDLLVHCHMYTRLLVSRSLSSKFLASPVVRSLQLVLNERMCPAALSRRGGGPAQPHAAWLRRAPRLV